MLGGDGAGGAGGAGVAGGVNYCCCISLTHWLKTQNSNLL